MSQWYYQRKELEYGPVSDLELSNLLREEKVSPLDRIRLESSDDWIHPGEVKDFYAVLSPKQRFLSWYWKVMNRKAPEAHDNLMWEDVESVALKAAIFLVVGVIVYGMIYLFTGYVPTKIPIPIK